MLPILYGAFAMHTKTFCQSLSSQHSKVPPLGPKTWKRQAIDIWPDWPDTWPQMLSLLAGLNASRRVLSNAASPVSRRPSVREIAGGPTPPTKPRWPPRYGTIGNMGLGKGPSFLWKWCHANFDPWFGNKNVYRRLWCQKSIMKPRVNILNHFLKTSNFASFNMAPYGV